MLTKQAVISFAIDLVESNDNYIQAKSAIKDYIEYLEKFASVSEEIKNELQRLPSQYYSVSGKKKIIIQDRSSSYESSSSSSCGSSFSSSCGRESSSSC